MTALTPLAGHRRRPPSSAATAPYRIAIVGAGPRGLHALEAVAAAYGSASGRKPVDVTFFDPAEAPGAGAVYAPSQPPWLRMNFPAKRVSAWSCSSADRPSRLGFVDWCHRRGHTQVTDGVYAPRSLVGAYLSDCFATLVKQLPPGITCRVEQQRVAAVAPLPSRVEIVAGGRRLGFDEAVVTTGHGCDAHARPRGGVWPLASIARHAEGWVGQRVAVRGFALTAIDAILALTEGQGGRFEPEGAVWRYRASGREPVVIAPFSRSGRPMYAKPDYAVAQAWGEWDGWRRVCDRLASLETMHGSLDFLVDIRPVLLSVADSFAAWARGDREPLEGGAARSWLDRQAAAPEDALACWEQSCAIAGGRRPPDPASALGEVWRRCYPQLVRLVSYGGLRSSSCASWKQFAVIMERVAFGPPAENVRRLLALVGSGRLDLGFLPAPAVTRQERGWRVERGAHRFDASVLVHAVIAGPEQNAQRGPLGKLLANGYLALAAETGGVKVDRQGRPVGAALPSGDRLRVFGRATEGWILGADTLNRELHPETARWAVDLVRRLPALDL
ncbi:hypothetical protein Pla175_29450 [Pirellulimonas nuda]|uniref:FAD-dependent urate hydroxylase HpyO/Asp monooxygenase CreE-like FAD/NAD(P)-binding domain-containing protein n=1 Tax=Pirellulimonas nuda TaxID=2528009 RepID=A0A518DDL4_9BACT|nr:FAD/NAD(P)-binding protein [Pirellulimonas nuda]QDU89553.1 hypothetical protein Pla175_29450 [Pirellulimonas nuda]